MDVLQCRGAFQTTHRITTSHVCMRHSKFFIVERIGADHHTLQLPSFPPIRHIYFWAAVARRICIGYCGRFRLSDFSQKSYNESPHSISLDEPVPWSSYMLRFLICWLYSFYSPTKPIKKNSFNSYFIQLTWLSLDWISVWISGFGDTTHLKANMI